MDVIEQINCKSNLRKVGNAIVEDTNEVARRMFDKATEVVKTSANFDRNALMEKIDSGEDLIREWNDMHELLTVKGEKAGQASENVLFSILRPPSAYGIRHLGQEERGNLSEGISSLFSAKRLSYRTILIYGKIILSEYFLINSFFGEGDELIVPITSIMLENEYFDSYGTAETLARMNGEYGGYMVKEFEGGSRMDVGDIIVKGMSENKCLRVYAFDRKIRTARKVIISINMVEGIKYKDEQGNWIP